MAYTKRILECFAADIPIEPVRSAFENAVAGIQFETRDGVELCVDHQVEDALRGTAAEHEIQALRARVIYYIDEEELGLKG